MWILLASLAEATPDAAPMLGVAQTELDRAYAQLQDQPEPPYFLAYQVVDTQIIEISASNGALTGSRRGHSRVADIDVRVGSPQLDNTHKIRDGSWFSEEPRAQVQLPVDDDALGQQASQVILWRETDDAYQAAVRRLTKVRGNEQVKVEREDQSDDFSPVEPVQFVQGLDTLELDVAAWEDLLRQVSGTFLAFPHVLHSGVSLQAEVETRLLVTSEGTRIQTSRTQVRVAVFAVTVADDGMQLQVYDHIDGSSTDALPEAVAVISMAQDTATRVTDLRSAPLLEPYTGPAILQGRAAGVFFHEVFGHRAEGHRQKDEDEGQTFTRMVGEPILPEFLSVVDDPTKAVFGHTDLNGHYLYDDEGVEAQRVQLIDHGILEGFLLSRAPIAGFPVSNGHGRRQPGNEVVARQGNLIVEAHETVSYDALRAQLMEEVEAQGKPYGLVVEDITGGFTLTGRITPNSFNVRPVSVWKVYPDGRPDELARGGDLIGTPLVAFSRIQAAADDPAVFNGVCGAESGWVPVSAISPSLLLSEIEVQRKEKENDRPPLLPAPGAPVDTQTQQQPAAIPAREDA
jgi:predicted Zn-dependent protease